MEALEEKHDYWIDFGRDNYAGVTWANVPEEDGRKLFLGWMSNWLYAQEVPTQTWRSAMTIARELKLVKQEDTYLVTSTPVEELEKYRSSNYNKENIDIAGNTVVVDSSQVDLAKAEIRFRINDLKEITYNFRLSNSVDEEFIVSYDHAEKQFTVDRSHAGKNDFSEKFATENSMAPRISDAEDLNVVLIIDKTSIEMFFDDGKTVMTEIFFPSRPWSEFSLNSDQENFSLNDLEVYELNFE